MKNVVLSSVAAVAVVGMLALSGCGGNSGNSKSSSNTTDFSNLKDSEKTSVAGSNVIVVSQEDKNGEAKNKVKILLTSRNNGDSCDIVDVSKCDKPATGPDCGNKGQDPCEVEVIRGCADATNGETLTAYANSTAFKIRDDANITASDANSTVRYNGLLKVNAKDDITDGVLYLKVDLDCSLGDAADGNRGVYLNGYTVDPNSPVYAVLADKDGNIVKDKDGNPVVAKGKVKFYDVDGRHNAYVDFEGNNGIDISGITVGEANALRVHFFTEMASFVPDESDVWSGATGGTGAGTEKTASGN